MVDDSASQLATCSIVTSYINFEELQNCGKLLVSISILSLGTLLVLYQLIGSQSETVNYWEILWQSVLEGCNISLLKLNNLITYTWN